MTLSIDRSHRPLHAATAAECAPLTATQPQRSDAHKGVSLGAVAQGLSAAMLLLSPVGALAAADKPSWRGVGNRQLMASGQPVTIPQPYSNFLAPKNAFNATSGFLVLDAAASKTQAVLNTTANRNTETFDINTQGQIVLSATDAKAAPTCLAVASAKYVNKTAVWADTCSNQNNYKWAFTDAGNIKGLQYYTISPMGQAQGAHFCLDVANASKDIGAKVEIYACNGGDNQKWTLVTDG